MGAELSKEDVLNGTSFPDCDLLTREKLHGMPPGLPLGNDELPEDIRGFYGHPLTNGTGGGGGSTGGTGSNGGMDMDGGGGETSQASTLAYIHEYHNLPALRDLHDAQAAALLRDDAHEQATLQHRANMSDLFIDGMDADGMEFLSPNGVKEDDGKIEASSSSSSTSSTPAPPGHTHSPNDGQVVPRSVGCSGSKDTTTQPSPTKPSSGADPYDFTDESDLNLPSLHGKRNKDSSTQHSDLKTNEQPAQLNRDNGAIDNGTIENNRIKDKNNGKRVKNTANTNPKSPISQDAPSTSQAPITAITLSSTPQSVSSSAALSSVAYSMPPSTSSYGASVYVPQGQYPHQPAPLPHSQPQSPHCQPQAQSQAQQAQSQAQFQAQSQAQFHAQSQALQAQHQAQLQAQSQAEPLSSPGNLVQSPVISQSVPSSLQAPSQTQPSVNHVPSSPQFKPQVSHMLSPCSHVNNTPQHSVNNTPQHSVNTPQHSVNNPPQHSVNNPPRHSVNNTPQHSVNNTPQHSVNNTPQHSVNNPPQLSVNNTPQHSVNNTPQHSVNNPQNSVNNTPQHSVNNTPQHSVNNTTQHSVNNTQATSSHVPTSNSQVSQVSMCHSSIFNAVNPANNPAYLSHASPHLPAYSQSPAIQMYAHSQMSSHPAGSSSSSSVSSPSTPRSIICYLRDGAPIRLPYPIPPDCPIPEGCQPTPPHHFLTQPQQQGQFVYNIPSSSKSTPLPQTQPNARVALSRVAQQGPPGSAQANTAQSPGVLGGVQNGMKHIGLSPLLAPLNPTPSPHLHQPGVTIPGVPGSLPLPSLAEPQAMAAPTHVQLPAHASGVPAPTKPHFHLPPLRSTPPQTPMLNNLSGKSTRPQPPQQLNFAPPPPPLIPIKSEEQSPSSASFLSQKAASESTKKILEALRNKLHIQAVVAEDNEALFNEIREIILNESLSGKEVDDNEDVMGKKSLEQQHHHMRSLPQTPIQPQSQQASSSNLHHATAPTMMRSLSVPDTTPQPQCIPQATSSSGVIPPSTTTSGETNQTTMIKQEAISPMSADTANWPGSKIQAVNNNSSSSNSEAMGSISSSSISGPYSANVMNPSLVQQQSSIANNHSITSSISDARLLVIKPQGSGLESSELTPPPPLYGPGAVIKPQGSLGSSSTTPPPLYGPHMTAGGLYTELKSPDSGFNENCVSPATADSMVPVVPSEVFDSPMSVSGAGAQRSIGKRRRSSCRSGGTGGGGTSSSSSKSQITPAATIPKIDPELSQFHYILDTPTSASQKANDDRMTYLNKGQFYSLILKHKDLHQLKPNTVFKSIIVVVFREDKSYVDQTKAWEFWHSRQHTDKQRILDIDTKNSGGLSAVDVDEVAHNAVTVRWRPHCPETTVSLAINCLSTDFSNQKGVKGLPLLLQVDTFEEGNTSPIHRGYCQLKIFCDKGAERKIRDEERRREAKSKEGPRKRMEDLYHPSYSQSIFYNMADLTKPPSFFSPSPEIDESLPSSTADSLYGAGVDSSTDAIIPRKRLRTDSFSKRDANKVLLYVREDHENVFTALLLSSPTLHGFCKAVEEKYSISSADITDVFKKSKKGILVRMDDNIIQHYSNEATFTLLIIKNPRETAGQRLTYQITLTELEEQPAS